MHVNCQVKDYVELAARDKSIAMPSQHVKFKLAPNFLFFPSSVTGHLPDPGQEIDSDAVKLLHIGGKKCKELKE